MGSRLIYCPELNASTVVLLFQKGRGESWSVRDYSLPGAVSVRYAREFELSFSSVCERILEQWDAPVISVTDLHFWHQLTVQTNDRLQVAGTLKPKTTSGNNAQTAIDQSAGKFPILDLPLLRSLPKARKTKDMHRILTSPNSEDWVTWNAFALAQKLTPHTWWQNLVRLAMKNNPQLMLPQGWSEKPKLSLWSCVPTPRDYEQTSRRRLRSSNIAQAVSRAESPRPVEGDSEIDISIHNTAVTVFIEAKLGSDISLGTEWDPSRNQIVRNIDSLLEDTRGTLPVFWMLVRDSGQGRAYTQMMHTYQNDPAKLIDLLPHRPERILRDLAARLTVIHWKDFVASVPESLLKDPLTIAIYQELQTRMQ